MRRYQGIVAAVALALSAGFAGSAAAEQKPLGASPVNPNIQVSPQVVMAGPLPDLVVKPDTVVLNWNAPQGSLKVKAHVRNEGKKASGPANLCLSIKDVHYNTTLASAQQIIPAYQPNTGGWITIETGTGNALQDSYYAEIVADCQNALTEVTKQNNKLVKQLQ